MRPFTPASAAQLEKWKIVNGVRDPAAPPTKSARDRHAEMVAAAQARRDAIARGEQPPVNLHSTRLAGYFAERRTEEKAELRTHQQQRADSPYAFTGRGMRLTPAQHQAWKEHYFAERDE